MKALEELSSELDLRNVDNVARTESYLELYAWTRAKGPDLPWLLMAHLVSRNAGYMMTDLAGALDRTKDAGLRRAMTTLFVMLERANFLIFHDAWHHVCAHLAGRTATLTPPRTPLFMCAAWERYEKACARGVTPAVERSLVLDLVHNEQHLIEQRVVHRRELREALDLLRIIELFGRDRPLVLPWPGGRAGAPAIRVGRFADITRRIATGQRIFDLALAGRAQRDAMYEWALAHPHTGSREAYGGRPGPTLREVWPIDRVRALEPDPHAEPEPDPDYV